MEGELAALYERGLAFAPHPGQWAAWESRRRFVCVLAGAQGGKTCFGPHWLYREVQQRGPGDYLVVTPTFQLLEKKALPEFRRLFEDCLGLGHYQLTPSRRFVFSEAGQQRAFGRAGLEQRTVVWFGYADEPQSLESATVKAAWLDEAGQKRFRLGAWEAIQRRLAIHQGRALITTTPYDLGWLKARVYDRWQAGDPDYDVIRFDSTENPAFPPEEFERARRELPAWRFDLFYRGIFTRPAGLIYDCFRPEPLPEGHTWSRFPIPHEWDRYVGLDFGGLNTAALFFAAERQHGQNTGRFFLYREYHEGGRTAAEHVRELLKGEPRTPTGVGGAASEEQWRREFRAAGLPVYQPSVADVEVGIQRVYAAHRKGELIVFDDLRGYLAEKQRYSRAVDERGEPTAAIENKETFHFMDAERYVVSSLPRLTRSPAGPRWGNCGGWM